MVPFVKNATATIPVVMLTSQDPVEAGVVASFARPGGNLTGVAFVSSETAGKRLQFLKEAVPSLTRVAVLWSPDHPDGEYRNTEATARRLGIQIQSLEVRGPGDFDGAFQAATRERRGTSWGQTRRSPCRAAHEVRACHQHEDGEGPWPYDPAVAAAAGGSGH